MVPALPTFALSALPTSSFASDMLISIVFVTPPSMPGLNSLAVPLSRDAEAFDDLSISDWVGLLPSCIRLVFSLLLFGVV